MDVAESPRGSSRTAGARDEIPPDRPSHAGSPPETRGAPSLHQGRVRRRATGSIHTLTLFNELGLAAPLLRALDDAGYTTPTPIQAQAIPTVLAGRDLLGIAQTGTGKTAAFALPILHRLNEKGGRPPRGGCRALVLSPTRELSSQIADSFKTYGAHLGLSVAIIFGGVPHGAAAPRAGRRRRHHRRHPGPPAGPPGRRHRAARPRGGAGAG